MRKMLKIIFDQMTTVSFFVLLYMGFLSAAYHFAGAGFSFEWYTPFAIILVSLLCCVISIVLLFSLDEPGSFFKLRVAAHFVLNGAVVLGCGYFFRWFTDPKEFAIVAIGYVVIYLLAWGVTMARFKYEEVLICRALDQIRDRE